MPGGVDFQLIYRHEYRQSRCLLDDLYPHTHRHRTIRPIIDYFSTGSRPIVGIDRWTAAAAAAAECWSPVPNHCR